MALNSDLNLFPNVNDSKHLDLHVLWFRMFTLDFLDLFGIMAYSINKKIKRSHITLQLIIYCFRFNSEESLYQ